MVFVPLMVLDRSHHLEDAGLRVRVRLARPTDRAGLAELLGQSGLTADEMDVRRLLRFAPGRRCGVVATTFDGQCERIVGFGAYEDDCFTLLGTEEVRQLLRRGLVEQSRLWSRRVA